MLHFVTVVHMLLVAAAFQEVSIAALMTIDNEVPIAVRGGPTLSQPTPS